MRAYFANGVDKMHIPWAVEGLPALLHLSLFLFFGGLVIFLFNIDHEVFTCVVWWIGLFSMVYGLITLLPLIRQDSPYSAPLSIPAWFFYASIQYITFKVQVIYFRTPYNARTHRHFQRLLGGLEKSVEDMVSERPSETDVQILSWTINALGDDDSLEKFFESMPGFFASKLVNNQRPFLEHHSNLSVKFWNAVNEFLGRTFSSNVDDSVKLHRLDISLKTMNEISNDAASSILKKIFLNRWDQVPETIEMAHTLTRWCFSDNQLTAQYARCIVTRVLATVRERDDHWVELAAHISGLPEYELRDNIAHVGDNLMLVTLIDFCRRTIQSDSWELAEARTGFDIRHTLPGLQRDFCSLWNESVQEARDKGPSSTPVRVLHSIRHLYFALHQATDAAQTVFTASTDSLDSILGQPSSYPLCDIPSHFPDSTAENAIPNSRAVSLRTQPGDSPDDLPHHSTSGSNTIPQQTKEASIVPGLLSPSHPTTPTEIGDSSQVSAATSPIVLISPRPSNTLLTGAEATAQQDITLTVTVSHHPEGTTAQLDIVTAPWAELDFTEVLYAASTPEPSPTLAPVPASAPPVLNRSSASRNTGAVFAFNPFLPSSSVVSTTPSRPIGNDPMLHLRPRGLVNTGNMCFTNAVLQLLVHSLPFLNMFRELGNLKGQRRAEGLENDGCATPLVDATMKFFEEFMFKEEPPLAQQAAAEKLMEDQAKKARNAAHSFEPSYLYGAMKGKRPLKGLLVRPRAMQCPVVTDVSWYNLYRTANNRMRKSFSACTSMRLTKSYLHYLLLLVAASQPMLHPE